MANNREIALLYHYQVTSLVVKHSHNNIPVSKSGAGFLETQNVKLRTLMVMLIRFMLNLFELTNTNPPTLTGSPVYLQNLLFGNFKAFTRTFYRTKDRLLKKYSGDQQDYFVLILIF